MDRVSPCVDAADGKAAHTAADREEPSAESLGPSAAVRGGASGGGIKTEANYGGGAGSAVHRGRRGGRPQEAAASEVRTSAGRQSV